MPPEDRPGSKGYNSLEPSSMLQNSPVEHASPMYHYTTNDPRNNQQRQERNLYSIPGSGNATPVRGGLRSGAMTPRQLSSGKQMNNGMIPLFRNAVEAYGLSGGRPSNQNHNLPPRRTRTSMNRPPTRVGSVASPAPARFNNTPVRSIPSVNGSIGSNAPVVKPNVYRAAPQPSPVFAQQIQPVQIPQPFVAAPQPVVIQQPQLVAAPQPVFVEPQPVMVMAPEVQPVTFQPQQPQAYAPIVREVVQGQPRLVNDNFLGPQNVTVTENRLPPRERRPSVMQQRVGKEIPQVVEKPVIVEKYVDKPFEMIIEKPVPNYLEVEVPYDVVVEKPVEKVITRDVVTEKIVEVPVQKHVDVPYERVIEVPVEQIVEVPVMVEEIVEVPVERVVEEIVEQIVENPVYQDNYMEVDANDVKNYQADGVLPVETRYVEQEVTY